MFCSNDAGGDGVVGTLLTLTKMSPPPTLAPEQVLFGSEAGQNGVPGGAVLEEITG